METINIMYIIARIKNKNYMIIPIDAEKEFATSSTFVIKIISKLGIEGNEKLQLIP